MGPRELFARMLFLRRIDEEIARTLASGDDFDSVIHSALGQEAAAVGVAIHRRPEDVLYSTHRGIGHCLAWGANPVTVIAESLGRSGGPARGLAGHMHLVMPEAGVLGTNGIVGGGISQAVGAAVGLRQLGSGGAAFCFLGDGAINTGAFHESLNLAAVWDAPVLFVCENNGFSEMTLSSAMTAGTAVGHAMEYGILAEEVDGRDVNAVALVAQRLLDHVRVTPGPALMEVEVFRANGHWIGDPEHYRHDGDKERFATRDPIEFFRASGILDTRTQEEIALEVDATVEDIFSTVVQMSLPTQGDVSSSGQWLHSREQS